MPQLGQVGTTVVLLTPWPGNIYYFISITRAIQYLVKDHVLGWGWHLCKHVVLSLLLFTRAEWLSAASLSVHLSCKGRCVFLALTATSDLCFIISSLKLMRKNISLHSEHRWVLLVEAKVAAPVFLHCSASEYVSQEHLSSTQIFRHLFAPRYEHREFSFHNLTCLTFFVY